MLDKIEGNSLDAWIDSTSLMYNDFEKTQKIITKACKKLKNGGKFLSITPKFETYGYYHDEKLGYHQCEPIEGWSAKTGIVQYTTHEDIDQLYCGPDFKTTNIYEKIIRLNNLNMSNLFIIEGVKV